MCHPPSRKDVEDEGFKIFREDIIVVIYFLVFLHIQKGE